MSARPTVGNGTWDTSLTNAVTTTSGLRTSGYPVNGIPTSSQINSYFNEIGQWLQYFVDGSIALVNVAISAGASVLGGLTTDTLIASSSITGAAVTATGNVVSGANLSVGGTGAIHGTLTMGVGANVALQGSGYVSHPTRSRSVAITQNRVTTATVAPTSPSFGTPGLIIPTSCNCYLEVDCLEPNEAIVTVTVNAPGTSSTAVCSLYKYDSGSGGLVLVPGTSGTSFISGKATMTVITPVIVGDFCYLIEVQTGANTVQLLSYDVASQA